MSMTACSNANAGSGAATERRLLMGNEAIALAAIAAGVNVACGYLGTPSTEIVETIARNNPVHAIHVEWSCNEKAAFELAAGASYSGARDRDMQAGRYECGIRSAHEPRVYRLQRWHGHRGG